MQSLPYHADHPKLVIVARLLEADVEPEEKIGMLTGPGWNLLINMTQ